MEGPLTRITGALVIALSLAGAGCRDATLYDDVPAGGGGATAPITWERTAGPPGEAIVALRSDNAGVLFAGSVGGRVYRTVTDGDDWMPVPLPYEGGSITQIIVDPLRRVFVANDVHGIYASFDGGVHWMPFNTGLPDTAVYALAYLPGGSFASGSAGGYLSTGSAAGGSWTAVWRFSRPVTSILAVSLDEYYCALWGEGVHRFSTGDSIPPAVNPGLPDKYVNVLHSGVGGYFFAGTRNAGLFRTDPSEIFWEDAGGGTVSRDVIAVRSSQYGELFAGTGTGVYRSLDAGTHWTKLDVGLGAREVRALAIDPNARVFAGTLDGVFRSIRHE